MLPRMEKNNMSEGFTIAIGFVFILEGFMPFLFPGTWRSAMQQVINQKDKSLRLYGLISMLIGVAWLYLTH